MEQQFFFSFSLLLLVSLQFTKTLSQSSPAASPAHAPAATTTKPPPAAPPQPRVSDAPPPVSVMVPPLPPSKGPINVVKILQKAGHFTIFIRIIKSTQEDIQIFSQLNSSTDGITIFAPSDGAFSSIIRAGTFNALTDQQKIELVQFHLIPRILTTSQFQTVSNPLKTLAGSGGRFSLNVTTSESMINVTSGLTNTTVSGIVYIDNNVAIYQVDKVLLPLDIFAPKPPAPAPQPPAKPVKSEGAEAPEVPKENTSGTESFNVEGHVKVMLGVVLTIAASMFSL